MYPTSLVFRPELLYEGEKTTPGQQPQRHLTLKQLLALRVGCQLLFLFNVELRRRRDFINFFFAGVAHMVVRLVEVERLSQTVADLAIELPFVSQFITS